MKRLADVAIALCCIGLASAIPSALIGQSPNTFHFKLVTEAPMYECDITGKTLSDKVVEAPVNSVFTTIGELKDSVIIRFWEWNDKEEDKQLTLNFMDTSKQEYRYFLLPKSHFNSGRVIPRYRTKPTFSAGTIVIPVKVRSSPFDFSTDITLGPSAGAKWRLSPYSDENFFNAMMGFGVTHITLDSLSTEGVIRQTSDRPALTLSFGGVFEFSNAQIGFFVGWDYISQNAQNQWIYQGKPWLSLGLGYAIISRSTEQVPGQAGKQ
ncbi:MAG TPA: hypothetical protein PKA00_13190 [Saprospiraceae bacterium]|nr:hypothetical protein [Saprospiraceae bacterium]HMQ83863.1 hypothetical protein [Saprospiraceae bacterium]